MQITKLQHELDKIYGHSQPKPWILGSGLLDYIKYDRLPKHKPKIILGTKPKNNSLVSGVVLCQ